MFRKTGHDHDHSLLTLKNEFWCTLIAKTRDLATFSRIVSISVYREPLPLTRANKLYKSPHTDRQSVLNTWLEFYDALYKCHSPMTILMTSESIDSRLCYACRYSI